MNFFLNKLLGATHIMHGILMLLVFLIHVCDLLLALDFSMELLQTFLAG